MERGYKGFEVGEHLDKFGVSITVLSIAREDQMGGPGRGEVNFGSRWYRCAEVRQPSCFSTMSRSLKVSVGCEGLQGFVTRGA